MLEYCPKGTLGKFLELEKKFSEPQACKFFCQILSAVQYLHAIGVVHRDIKPENVLLDDEGNAKLIDFGLGNLYSPLARLKTPCGSPCYAPPEMVTGKEYDPEKTDIWSAGITLYYMLVGKLPFNDKHIKELYKKIVDGTVDYPAYLSAEAIDLIRGMLSVNPKARFGFKEILAHPWVQRLKPSGYPVVKTTSKVWLSLI